MGLQVVVTESAEGWRYFSEGKISTGAAVSARGQLVKSPGGKQNVSYWTANKLDDKQSLLKVEHTSQRVHHRLQLQKRLLAILLTAVYMYL